MRQYPTIDRLEARADIEAGKLKPAYLYEPDHAPKGTVFVYVDFGNLGKRLYRRFE